MQNKKNSKIISKLVLSTTAAFMATMAVKATEEPNDVQSQVENFQQEDQLQVAYATSVGNTIDKSSDAVIGAKYEVTKEYIAANDSEQQEEVYGNVKLTDVSNKSITAADDTNVFKNVTDSSETFDVTAIAGEATEGDKTGAFSGCDKLVSVEIPDTVTDIGQNAFHDCKKLEYIKIDNKDIVLDNSIVSGNTDVKIVYVTDGANVANIKTYTGADEVRIIETSLKAPDSAENKIESVTATDNSITIKWKHVSGTEMYAISRKIGSGASLTIGVYHVPSGTEADTVLEFVDKNEDKKVEFGKKCTYTVTPYNLHDEYKNVTLENFKTYSNDPFGMKKAAGDSEEFTYNEFKKNNVTSHYTTVTDTDGTREGSYANIESGKNHAVYSLNGNCYGITQNGEFDWDDNASGIITGTDGNVALYIREWDMTKDSEKTAFEDDWGADTQEKVARVFSLQVVGNVGSDSAMIDSGDTCAEGVSYDGKSVDIPMYIELDNTWNTNDLTVKAIRKGQVDNTLSHEIVTNPVGFPAGKYIKIMLDKFNVGPYAIYADKLENAGTNNSELCKTCGKSKDECTCKKDECPCDDDCACKKEDGTCECGKNDCKYTGTSSSTSHGYKTGDVASAGLLQSAFGMLAAAGSTLMGLFRKKKDRE